MLSVGESDLGEPAWAEDEAARFVVSGRNGRFDPEIVDAFVAVLSARDPDLGEQLLVRRAAPG